MIGNVVTTVALTTLHLYLVLEMRNAETNYAMRSLSGRV